MKRLRHFMNTVQTNWSEQPAARGAAKMTAGGVLVAEGLFGVVSNRLPGKARAGLTGNIFLMVVGGIFIAVYFLFIPSAAEDELTTTGEIIDVSQGRNRDGGIAYSAIYGYVVGGETYELGSSVSTSQRPRIGTEVTIGYSASDPRDARRIGGAESNLPLIFVGAGVIAVAAGLFGTVISLVMIGFGIKLFRDGRRDRSDAGEASQGFFKDLMSLARQVDSGEVDVDATAAGVAGASIGSPSRMFRSLLAGEQAWAPNTSPAAAAPDAPTMAPPPPQIPSGPAAGWYAAPDGSANWQWWDGGRWTDHRSPS